MDAAVGIGVGSEDTGVGVTVSCLQALRIQSKRLPCGTVRDRQSSGCPEEEGLNSAGVEMVQGQSGSLFS